MAVDLDPKLLEILACPSADHAPLSAGTPADPDAEALTCTSCGRQYPVVDGVPVLLLDEAVIPQAIPHAPTAQGGPAGGAPSEP